jgi:cell wall-associated NlpC family hydrolase
VDNKIELMLSYAALFVCKPYIWGGDDPIIGFDCSGFVQECYSAIGLDPVGDQTAQGLYDYYSNNNWIEKKQRGSILFFGKSRSKITHTAIAIDEDFMFEAGGGNSTTINLVEAAKKNAFIRLRPIRKDLVAYLYPPN